jgi:hypothetical protein
MLPVFLAPWVAETIVVTVASYAGKKVIDKMLD